MAIVKPATVIVPDVGPDGPMPSLPLPDGRQVDVRPVSSTDGARALRLPDTATAPAIPLRFLTIGAGLGDALVDRLLHVDDHDRQAVIATVGDELVGVGRFERCADPDRAQVAIAVADDVRGLGVERALYGALLARAHHEGIATVVPAGEGS